MSTHTPTSTHRKPSEDGYILITVVFMLALFIIALAVAAPRVAKSIQREREIETMHRGKQYARAVRLYYRRFGRYPPNVDALVNTNEMRFLRKKYIDPTTGKDEWKLIHFGQNKTQPMGFFGQPLMGSTPGMTTGSLTGTPGIPGAPGVPTGTVTSPPVDPNAPPTTTDPNVPSAPTGTDPNTPGGTTGTGLTGQTFGGGGIIGVTPGSPKQSILVYKKKTKYNEWEFFYDPRVETMMQGGNLGNNGLNPSNPTGTNPPGTTGGPTPVPPSSTPPQQ